MDAKDIVYMYDSYLLNLKYGHGYDERIHAIQSALSIIGYHEEFQNGIEFGYYTPKFEEIIQSFKYKYSIGTSGNLDIITWAVIVEKLIKEWKCTIYVVDGKVVLSKLDEALEKERLDKIIDMIFGSDSSNMPSYDVDYGNSGSSNSNNNGNNGSSNGGIAGGEAWPGVDLDYSGNAWDSNNSNNSNINNNLGYNINGEYTSINKIINANYPYTPEEVQGPHRPDTGTAHGSERNYKYISLMLTNTMTDDQLEKHYTWKSEPTPETIGLFGGAFDKVANLPFFHPARIGALRKSLFDITIVYGSDGAMARKIIGVTPISVATEVNASGDPVYDVYEFIAQDIVYNK